MKIKLKAGASVSPENNLHGLTLEDYYALESGKAVEVDAIPDSLKGKVESKTKKKEAE